jgi:hypothetical protein
LEVTGESKEILQGTLQASTQPRSKITRPKSCGKDSWPIVDAKFVHANHGMAQEGQTITHQSPQYRQRAEEFQVGCLSHNGHLIRKFFFSFLPLLLNLLSSKGNSLIHTKFQI